MEVKLDQLYFKPSDFKICKTCKKVNWYERTACSCGGKNFDKSEDAVFKAYQKELNFWIEEEELSEEEADNIYYEV